MSGKEQRISSGPLFRTFRARGDAANFAKKLNISQQRLKNWQTRGIPAHALPEVARALGKTVEGYLREAGRPVPVNAPEPVYITPEEKIILEGYRRASPEKKATMRLIASATAPDEKMGEAWRRPDRRKVKV